MKQWFTANEIAEVQGVNRTTIQRQADRGNWEAQKRMGKGGGWEYHISNLPLAAREALAAQITSEIYESGKSEGEKLALSNSTQGKALQRAAQSGLKALQGLKGKAKVRAEARLAILTMLDVHVSTLGGSFEQGLQSFMRLYMADQLNVDPQVKAVVPKFSRASLYRWIKELNESGAASLAGQYGGRKGSGLIDSQPLLKQFVLGMLAAHPTTSAANIMKAVESEFRGSAEVQIPAKRSLQKWLKAWKEDNAGLLRAVTNPDAWKNKDMVAFGSYREGVDALNALWEFDSTPADVMFTDGRYSILGAIDVYSARLKFIVRKTSDSHGVAAVVRRALLDWGVPERAKTDNGADYKSNYIQTVFKALHIKQDFCQPFCGWQKPHIERAFRTFSHDIAELLSGFIGHNVSERQAIEARKAFSDRLFKKDQVIDINMSSTDFQSFCDRWIENIYNTQPHSGLGGKTPLEMVREWNQPIHRIEDERSLDILLAEAPGNNGNRTVGKKGIKLDNGLYIAAELAEHINEPVMVRYDAEDAGRIFVYNTLGNFICIAQDPDITGVSREEIAIEAKRIQKEAIEAKRRELKALGRKVSKRGIAEQILADREAERLSQNVTDFPKRTASYTTPALEAAAEAANALDNGNADTFETASPDMPQSEFERRRNEIRVAEAEQKEAAARKVPLFENEWERAWWLTKEQMQRELVNEEAQFLERYRKEQPEGAKSIDAMVAALPGGNHQIGLTLNASQ